MIDVTAIMEARKVLDQNLEHLLPLLRDKNFDLNVRWDAYTKLVNANILVKDEMYSDGMLGDVFGHDRVSLYDDFYMDRHQSKTFPEIWEAMNQDWFSGGECYKDQAAKDKWRELVLASGYSSFTHDW